MTSTPPPRRRRIAGERRRPGERPEPESAESTGTEQPPMPAGTEQPPAPAGAERPARRNLFRRRRETSSAAADPRPEPTPRDSAPARGGWWGTPVTLIGLAVALVLMITVVALGALGIVTEHGISDIRDAEDAQVAAESAPSVAERAAEAILAYDYRRLDADQSAATKFMTGSFAEEYSTTFERTVKSAARTYKAQVSAQVRSSSVVRAGPDQVKVLLFIDQTTKSTAHKRAQVALNRVEFVMVREDGEWLVDDISSY